MKKTPFIFLFFFALQFVFLSCSSESNKDDALDDNSQLLVAETLLDVSYGENEQQVYDIYLPAGRTADKTKVIILIHGGGWTGGDKADMTNFVSLIQQNHPDHAIVNMNYVLATTTVPAFPNQFLDVGRVVNKLVAEAEALQILPEFGFIGISAGAHIALQYDYVYDTNDRVKMVCDIVGPTDFTDPFYANDPSFPIALSLLVDESAYPADTNYAEAVSPALQVNSNSSPSILFYGDTDPLVPLTNGQQLQTSLSNSQITHSFTVYEGGHGTDWDISSTTDLQEQLSSFIEIHLPVL